MADDTMGRWRDDEAKRWAEIDALIDEALAARRTGPSRDYTSQQPWDCVDDDGNPREVASFTPAVHLARDPTEPPDDRPLLER